MKHQKLTDDINALCIDPEKEVLIIQFKRKLTDKTHKSIARTLNAWSKKSGVSCIVLAEPTTISVVNKSELPNGEQA